MAVPHPSRRAFCLGVLDFFAALSIMVIDVLAGSGELESVSVSVRELWRRAACGYEE